MREGERERVMESKDAQKRKLKKRERERENTRFQIREIHIVSEGMALTPPRKLSFALLKNSVHLWWNHAKITGAYFVARVSDKKGKLIVSIVTVAAPQVPL